MKILPEGATALDFAFSIHSDIGCTCQSVKINNRLERIDYVLKSGDQVEVITKKTQKPKEDWLQFVVTGKAKNRIRSALREEKRSQAEYGREILERKLNNFKVSVEDNADMLARWFERVVCFSGNHDWRLLKQLMGAFPAQTAEGLFLELIGGSRGGRVTWSVFGHAEVDSPAGPWRFTHQRNYSRIRGRVAVQLAAKYARHIVTFHEHGLGKLPSDCGRFTCAASGCLANWDHMAYMQLVDTTAPAWVNGYVMLDATGAIEVYGAVPGWGAPLVPSGSLSAEA
jgi:hypothetical protein